jgi:hypothetical protein
MAAHADHRAEIAALQARRPGRLDRGQCGRMSTADGCAGDH